MVLAALMAQDPLVRGCRGTSTLPHAEFITCRPWPVNSNHRLMARNASCGNGLLSESPKSIVPLVISMYPMLRHEYDCEDLLDRSASHALHLPLPLWARFPRRFQIPSPSFQHKRRDEQVPAVCTVVLLKETHDSAYCVVVDKSFEREETQAVYPHYDARCFEIVLHDATFVQQNAFEPLGEGGVVFAGFIVQPTEQSSEVSDEVFQIENLRENRQHVGVEGAEVGDLDTPGRRRSAGARAFLDLCLF